MMSAVRAFSCPLADRTALLAKKECFEIVRIVLTLIVALGPLPRLFKGIEPFATSPRIDPGLVV